MAEHLAYLEEVKRLPASLHLLCPRQDSEDQDRYDDATVEDDQGKPPENDERSKHIDEARKRRKDFMSCLQLLAYDGPESERYQRFIWERLENALGLCDLCIREYYKSKKTLKTSLKEEYDEEDVQKFFEIIDGRDIRRICRGLDAAAKTLRELPEHKRVLGAVDVRELHAIFEALNCDVFLKDEERVRKHFDEPFRLIQTKKQLRIREYLPATVTFLFNTNSRRLAWATDFWQRIDRSPTDIEWDFAVRGPVETHLQQASSPESIARLWSALRFIVPKLDKRRIAHDLCDLVPNVCMSVLEHLARPTHAIGFIVQTMKIILDNAPDAFWQAMGSISSPTIVEQVFASLNFNKVLQTQTTESRSVLNVDTLSWIPSFIDSLKPGNRPVACNTIADQLLQRVQDTEISEPARFACYHMTVKTMLKTITSFSDNSDNRQNVNRVVLTDTLSIVGHRVNVLLDPPKLGSSDEDTKTVRTEVLSLVRNALALDCQCLKADFERISQTDEHGQVKSESLSSYSPEIWDAITKRLNEDDTKLSSAALNGTMALPGLELFRARDGKSLSKEKHSYNDIFIKVTGKVSEVLAKLSECRPSHLDGLFQMQDTSMALVAALFSADQSTYESAIALVKNISGQSGRKEAIGHLLQAFFSGTIYALCWVLRRIASMKTFASVPRMLKTGMEILDVLCNPEDGILRTKHLDNREFSAVQSYWSFQWIALRTVFRLTEQWSNEMHDKPMMTDVCRDTMQYADALLHQCDLFYGTLSRARPDRAKDLPRLILDASETESGSPVKALECMARWLRLRDEYLAETLVNIITKMFGRLKRHEVFIIGESLAYVENVAVGTGARRIKTILSEEQKARLVQALERYQGRVIRAAPKKQATLKDWADASSSGAATPISRNDSSDEFEDTGLKDKDIYAIADSLEAQNDSDKKAKITKSIQSSLAKFPSKQSKPVLPSLQAQLAAKQAQSSKSFLEQRKLDEAARKKREAEARLRLRGETGIGQQTKGQGSGLAGIGVQGKDHSVRPSDLMVSESDSSDEDSDEEIFGKAKDTRVHPSMLPRKSATPAGPVRKVKQIRSVKDMRARLAPDLSNLHRQILSWDFFAETDFPPNSDRDNYTLVNNTFRTADDYQKTFEPLLILEGWQSFRAAREDGTFKAFEVNVSNSLIIDSFVEINSTMSFAEGKELSLGASDVVLLSKGKQPQLDMEEPHCLAHVKEISRKKGEVQVVYRVNAANNPLRSQLKDSSTVNAIQVLSLTTLEREYGALMALQYYDLCDEIITAKPSPLLDYPEHDLAEFVSTYNLNLAQAKAVKSALDNDAFTLIQGPPGSGKTKTICALVGAMMSSPQKAFPSANAAHRGHPASSSQGKKILVCAPSNAAVDELVIRFKEGVKLTNGSGTKLSVVRLGRSEAINAQVKDLTLEELVNAKLNLAAPKDPKEDIHSVMMQHKSVSEELNMQRDKMAEIRTQGQPITPDDEQLLDGLKRKKNQLGTKIDDMRERQNTASRDAELSRKRIQQEILDSAHVLCATLSGSGHEIFQGLNVEFETVIIDEAAQSIELSALIPLKYGCAKCILVGDPKQLPPTVLSREAARFQYQQSLFARMENNHRKDVHLLDTQYRMHPEISLFPSRTFYDSRLKDGPDMAKLRARPWHHSTLFAPYRFFDVQGMSESAPKGRSLVNVAELNVAMQMYDRLISDVSNYDFRGKIGIITPYKGQLKELKYRFAQRYGQSVLSDVEFNTTDAFQGRESEIIIFSCVRASTKGIGFLNDIRRMNVGLTRAKCSLWVLGNSEALAQGEFWRSLVSNAKERKLYTDGDVLALFRRTLLTQDMMKDDVEMKDADFEATSGRKPSPADHGRPTLSTAAPVQDKSRPIKRESPPMMQEQSDPSRANSVTSIKSSVSSEASKMDSSSKFTDRTTKQHVTSNMHESYLGVKADDKKFVPPVSTRVPSRPYSDFSNPNHPVRAVKECAKCGSENHHTAACDNEDAQAAALICYRCKRGGHLYTSCPAPRCITCGEVGHTTNACTALQNQRLTKEQQEQVKRQEVKFGIDCDNARERRAKRQLGEHAATIPEVKSTISAPIGPSADIKRKRDDAASPVEDERAKSIKTINGRVDGVAGAVPTGPRVQNVVTGNGIPRPPGGRPNGGPPVPIIRKKKASEADMFMKRK